MIQLNEAREMARQYFLDNFHYDGIASVLEGPTEWFFLNGKPGQISIGGAMIGINKETGEILSVILPTDEGFARLEGACQISEEGSEPLT